MNLFAHGLLCKGIKILGAIIIWVGLLQGEENGKDDIVRNWSSLSKNENIVFSSVSTALSLSVYKNKKSNEGDMELAVEIINLKRAPQTLFDISYGTRTKSGDPIELNYFHPILDDNQDHKNSDDFIDRAIISAKRDADFVFISISGQSYTIRIRER